MQDRAFMVAAKQWCHAVGELAAIKTIEDKIKLLDAKKPQHITGRRMLVRACNIQLMHDQSAGNTFQINTSRRIIVKHG